MNEKIDITSTALEKGIDTAKGFLDKLITPSIEETGLLMRDKIVFWKFKNQVKTLNKAKLLCERNNISLKAIPMKLLCPLLENAALEEDDQLQDKWAILLSNLVDSEQNIENHVFPYILSQLSLNEFGVVEQTFNNKIERITQLNKELVNFRETREDTEKELKSKIEKINIKIAEERIINSTLQKALRETEWELRSLGHKEISIKSKIRSPQSMTITNIRDFELSNIIRLGLVKFVQETTATTQTLEIPNDPDSDYLTVDIDVELEADEDYVLTELGELFVSACQEKNKK